MVKSLTHCSRCLLLALSITLLLIVGVFAWMHAAERSLNWAKPWILGRLNRADTPYLIALSDVSVNWHDLTEFGHISIENVTLSKRDGAVFAVLPHLNVTIDPLGFIPGRNLLNSVWLDSLKLFLTRDAQGSIQLGLEGANGTMKLADLFQTANDETNDKTLGSTTRVLPFHKFYVRNASLNFSDVSSGTSLVSESFSMGIVRGVKGYHAQLAFPFRYEDDDARLDAKLSPIKESADQLLEITLTKAPAKLLCVFGLCPDNIEGTGPVSGTVGLRLLPSGVPTAVQVQLSTNHASINAPELFEKPLLLGESSLIAYSTAASHTITIAQSHLKLEDTTIDTTGTLHNEDGVGWTVELVAKTGSLEVTKVRKYWPLPMAPESRLWVTSKMKRGYAESGVLKVHLKPGDLAAEALPDEAIEADVDARAIGFEYLPGFPEVTAMDGLVRFTGRTIKVAGSNGSMLTGTKISKATLWMPDLMNPRNPTETQMSVTATASDVVTLLALKHFTFDDSAMLDPLTIRGEGAAELAMKFDSFSEKKSANPDEINFDHVEYDISATMKNIAQDGFFGSYDLKSFTGKLEAKNSNTAISGDALLGDAAPLSIRFSQAQGGPIQLGIKNTIPVVNGPSTDMSMTYQSGGNAPSIRITGNSLDATASYGKAKNSLLANFPAMQAELALDSLWLTKVIPLTRVDARLNCSAERCESAELAANAGKGQVRGSITRVAGQRQFSLKATNAGDFLSAIDFSDRMHGGTLDLHGPYDDNIAPPALNAKLSIRDFTLQNSQILGRILTVTSFTGVQNLLTGSGISFNKMLADIRQRAGVITVAKGRANGASIGITVEGTIDTNTTGLKLKGVVVPAYAFNSLLSNIPIIGDLLGGDGEGIIAFNYGVSGTYANPDVGVNPLSGLTPGFMRGIFGVFDSKAKMDEGVPVDDEPATLPASPVPTKPMPAAKVTPAAEQQLSKPVGTAAPSFRKNER